jgi:hypothetical protein
LFLVGIRELLGHKDVKTTMVYTHVLNRRPAGICRLVDSMLACQEVFYADSALVSQVSYLADITIFGVLLRNHINIVSAMGRLLEPQE